MLHECSLINQSHLNKSYLELHWPSHLLIIYQLGLRWPSLHLRASPLGLPKPILFLKIFPIVQRSNFRNLHLVLSLPIYTCSKIMQPFDEARFLFWEHMIGTKQRRRFTLNHNIELAVELEIFTSCLAWLFTIWEVWLELLELELRIVD